MRVLLGRAMASGEARSRPDIRRAHRRKVKADGAKAMAPARLPALPCADGARKMRVAPAAQGSRYETSRSCHRRLGRRPRRLQRDAARSGRSARHRCDRHRGRDLRREPRLRQSLRPLSRRQRHPRRESERGRRPDSAGRPRRLAARDPAADVGRPDRAEASADGDRGRDRRACRTDRSGSTARTRSPAAAWSFRSTSPRAISSIATTATSCRSTAVATTASPPGRTPAA